jgi:hypothetical protein
MNFTSQTAAMKTAIDLSNVSLSGSNTRDEWMLKNSGVTTTAASQPASSNPSQYRCNFESIPLPELATKSIAKCGESYRSPLRAAT